jgi:hypothetical protein
MHQSAVQLAQMRTGISRTQVSRTQVTRPHSADFLESGYEPAIMSPQTPGGHPVGGNSRGNPRHKAQPPRPKSSIEQRTLMDKTTFEESQIRSQSRASGVFDRNYHNQQVKHFLRRLYLKFLFSYSNSKDHCVKIAVKTKQIHKNIQEFFLFSATTSPRSTHT